LQRRTRLARARLTTSISAVRRLVRPYLRSSASSVSMPVLSVYRPAPMQLVAVGHVIPSSSVPLAPAGFAAASTVHALPFQLSASARTTPAVVYRPTAMQAVVLVHLRARSSFVSPGLGVASTVHVVPFHLSASVSVRPKDSVTWPTATHRVVDGQATSVKLPQQPAASGGLLWVRQRRSSL
jgi:hypothetical protein